MTSIDTAELLIRIGVGITMVIFGFSQMRTPQAWLNYIPKIVQFIMPLKPSSFMRIHSVGNLILGIFLLSSVAPLVATWCALLWWLFILPFAYLKDFMIGMRDFTIVMSLIALLALQ